MSSRGSGSTLGSAACVAATRPPSASSYLPEIAFALVRTLVTIATLDPGQQRNKTQMASAPAGIGVACRATDAAAPVKKERPEPRRNRRLPCAASSEGVQLEPRPLEVDEFAVNVNVLRRHELIATQPVVSGQRLVRGASGAEGHGSVSRSQLGLGTAGVLGLLCGPS
jgi:hypothetical protein